MRILFVNEGLTGGGGVETYLSTLLPALHRAGHDIGVLHDNPASQTAPQRIAPEGTWHAGVQDLGLENAIGKVREFAPDVCLSHNMRSLDVESRLIDEWPVVKMMHGHFGTCVSGQKTFVFPAIVACARTFGPGCLVHYLPRRCGHASPVRMMREYKWGNEQRSLFSEYQAIVVASRYMRDEYLRAGVPPGSVHAIPLFAPPVPRDAQVGGTRPIDVLFIGRLTNLKGADAVVDAVSAAGRRLGRPLTTVFAGEGPELAYVRDLAVARGVNATFPGWVTADERDRLIRDASILAVPSRWPEPFGLVGLEAAAFGTPAVAFDIGGIRDWLTNDENGRLIDPATDSDGMGDAIAQILGNPALHARLSAGALAAAARFTIDAHVAALTRVLQQASGLPTAAE
ncbi:MAG TPA: glycosyltransferase family 4 protein [Vicinamibacterales bacterium]|nr:glycosyltransferase family 4 protein [Vicinamibacterales bacterium]